jgi:hypothetical protein
MVPAILTKFKEDLANKLPRHVGEPHAYGDGMALYQQRADEIRRRGDRGQYPD